MGTTQPKHAPYPHAIPDSSASWAGVPDSAHITRTASSIAGGPQANTSRAGSVVSASASSSVTRPWWPALPSSVATSGAAEQRRPRNAHPVAEAEQNRGGPGPAELVLEDRQRRDPHPAADEQREAAWPRGAEAVPERPDDLQLLIRAELAQAGRARSDVLEQEVELVAVRPGLAGR